LLKYSIIITAWNRKKFIHAAFQSAVNHDYSGAYKIIVVANFIDDVLLSSSFENPVKIRYIVDESEGLGGKMRAIIMASGGQWICFLEDDNLFTSNKL
jgi:glycosyltransferase involved in cell wall biosynthesis